MKLLLSAYACEPNFGSEGGVGWNIVRALSENYDLSVLTRANNEELISSSDEVWVKKVNWIYTDPPKWLCFWKKGARGVQLYYILWQIYALKRVRKEKVDYDVVHHVTFGRYWVPSFLVKLGKPFVFGPVGGGDRTPEQLAAEGSLKARLPEIVKAGIHRFLTMPTPIRKYYLKMDKVIAATHQTAEALKDIGVSNISVQVQSGLSRLELDKYSQIERTKPSENSPITLITACRLIGWKAVDIAIEAVAEVRARGVDVRLNILQEGPEKENLVSLVKRLDIEREVDFLGRLDTLEEVYQSISRSDALFHPALHEAFGQSVLESLSLGVPVVCLDWGGPGVIVGDDCGYKIKPSGRSETIQRFADAIEALGQDRHNFSEISIACRKRANEFCWDQVIDSIENAYSEVTRIR